MVWIVRGPWAAIKWVWAGTVLVGYVLLGVLSIVTWFTAEPTVYNNNPPGGGRKPEPPRKPEGDVEQKAS